MGTGKSRSVQGSDVDLVRSGRDWGERESANRLVGATCDGSFHDFEQASGQDNPRIDPKHHFVFARDQWPTLRFDEAIAMDRPWWGSRPFLSGHNARPTYDFVQDRDKALLRLGPVSYAVAPIGPDRIEPGRYVLSVRLKSVHVHGPGGRIELLRLKKCDPHGNGFVRMDAGNILDEQVRYFGHGSFDWREVSFAVDVPPGTRGLALGLGNDRTGDLFISEVRLERSEREVVIGNSLSADPVPRDAIAGALWDLRMHEHAGMHVYSKRNTSPDP